MTRPRGHAHATGLIRLLHVVLLLLCACALTTCSSTPPRSPWPSGASPDSRLHRGDTPEQVAKALSDAWYYAECYRDLDRLEEVYLYGPANRDEIGVISVTYFRRWSESFAPYGLSLWGVPAEFDAPLDFFGSARTDWYASHKHCLPPALSSP